MRAFIIPIAVIILDQIAKFLANKNLLPSIGGFFETISCNKGIAFGTEIPLFAFVLLWILSMIILVRLIRTEKENLPLFFVLGGAISNLIDRIFFGCVTDYISFMNIPTFNIADIAITLGVMLFIIKTPLINEKQKS